VILHRLQHPYPTFPRRRGKARIARSRPTNTIAISPLILIQPVKLRGIDTKNLIDHFGIDVAAFF
jgi:hypothetical protein